MPLRAVLFDIDGTLVDSNVLHVDAWHHAFAEHGHPVARAAIARQIGKGSDHLVPALLPGAGEEEIEQLGKGHDAHFRKHGLDRVVPFPAARELLQRCREAGMRIALASSAKRAEVDHYLGLLDANALVELSTSADDVGASKPSPDIFASALGRFGDVEPGQAVVVGDTPYDMEAARRCGLHTLAVRSGGFGDAVLLAAGAEAFADDVADVLRRFDELLRR